jgi:hypothetical protein
MGVLALQDPVPVIVPLETVPLPVNSTKLPLASPATKSRLNVPLAGRGLAATPIRTPCPFEELGNPVPEIDPCAVLLLAIKQTGPCTENVPIGVVTLQGLGMDVPDPPRGFLAELQPAATISRTSNPKRAGHRACDEGECPRSWHALAWFSGRRSADECPGESPNDGYIPE